MWWRDRRWRELLGLIDGLPKSSRFMEAVLNDPEMFDSLPAPSNSGGEWSPEFTEWTTTTMILGSVVDELRQLQQIVIGTAGGRPKRVNPFPTPVTLWSRAGKRQVSYEDRLASAQAIVDMATPGRSVYV